ncbi:hypothetical protein [Arthrobacter mobilis]|uniref:Uncharacterized protein n=1 Tax=Arthrobacter mobilis TaxID=2724944 RepID=A0A7X6K3V0_9MICC|nr:hypothetical protein [Arthrobacter mobilis]NKX54697.1 hypothetical protein [Arthrobacter mobilis]
MSSTAPFFLLTGLDLATMIPYLLLVCAYVLRLFAVRRSRQRYRLTGVMWLMLWPALAHIGVGIIRDAAVGRYGWPDVLAPVLLGFLWHRIYRDLRRGGEDHEFRGFGGRLKLWLGLPAPAAAGTA